MSTILKFAFVIALMYVVILILKWLSNKKILSPRTTSDLKVMDAVRLSQNNTLHVVNTRGKSLLIASSPGQITVLAEFDVAEGEDASDASAGQFAEYLAKYSSDGGQSTPASRITGLIRDCNNHLQNRRVYGVNKQSGGTEDEK